MLYITIQSRIGLAGRFWNSTSPGRASRSRPLPYHSGGSTKRAGLRRFHQATNYAALGSAGLPHWSLDFHGIRPMSRICLTSNGTKKLLCFSLTKDTFQNECKAFCAWLRIFLGFFPLQVWQGSKIPSHLQILCLVKKSISPLKNTLRSGFEILEVDLSQTQKATGANVKWVWIKHVYVYTVYVLLEEPILGVNKFELQAKKITRHAVV